MNSVFDSEEMALAPPLRLPSDSRDVVSSVMLFLRSQDFLRNVAGKLAAVASVLDGLSRV